MVVSEIKDLEKATQNLELDVTLPKEIDELLKKAGQLEKSRAPHRMLSQIENYVIVLVNQRGAA